MGFNEPAKKMIKALNNIEFLALAYIPVVFAVLIVIEMVNRKLGLKGFPWLEEMSRHMLIFITFMGASVAIKTKAHMVMDVLYLKLPTKLGHLLKAFVYLGCAILLAFIDYYAWIWIIKLERIGITTSTLKIPFFIPYLSIGVFLIGMVIRYTIESVKEFLSFWGKDSQELKSQTEI